MHIDNSIAVSVPDILLPKEGTDLKKWAVIACDQYTSEPDYWQKIESEVGDAPSTLRIVLPEVYLPREDEDGIKKRLSDIASSIDEYMTSGVWDSPKEGFIVLDRSTPVHPSRKGLMLAVDLEQYSYEPGNKEKIRATEGTVLERIPPRVRIRANAKVEVPHIMLLIDDPKDSVIGMAWDEITAGGEAPCYDTELMAGSGSIKGYFIPANSELCTDIIVAFKKLLSESSDGMLFAVGDGNHSLASAKAHWDNIKKDLSDEEKKTHPARYALAEVVNIHDRGLDFEPIHRVVFGITPEKFIEEAKEYFKDNGVSIASSPAGGQWIKVVGDIDDTYIVLSNPPHSLSVGSIQGFIDKMGYDVDYIHGEDSVRKLAEGSNTGILLPDVGKDSFFDTISAEGVFPRKTFSMGEAFEKRFYFEAKRID
ncbi:MAG: DUF1015 domain-containing protein [Saccharofermentans sp.]|nr:DUF1015 domain-containing protein [Saccharofermentans sp.]